MLHAACGSGIETMFFAGNSGSIQIHTKRPMEPWQIVMGTGCNTHLRREYKAEIRAGENPTKGSGTVQIEAFDGESKVTLQCCAIAKEGRDHRPDWVAMVDGLKGAAHA